MTDPSLDDSADSDGNDSGQSLAFEALERALERHASALMGVERAMRSEAAAALAAKERELALRTADLARADVRGAEERAARDALERVLAQAHADLALARARADEDRVRLERLERDREALGRIEAALAKREGQRALEDLAVALAETSRALEARGVALEQFEARAEVAEEERIALAQSLSDRNAELGHARERLAENLSRVERLERERDLALEDARTARARADELADEARRHDAALANARRDIDRAEQKLAMRETQHAAELRTKDELAARAERALAELVQERVARAELVGRLGALEAELARARDGWAARLGRSMGPRARAALAIALVLAASGAAWWWRERLGARAAEHPRTAKAAVALAGVALVLVMYRARHRRGMPSLFRWSWLAASRSRWLGLAKLAGLFVLHAALACYLKAWERLRGRRAEV